MERLRRFIGAAAGGEAAPSQNENTQPKELTSQSIAMEKEALSEKEKELQKKGANYKAALKYERQFRSEKDDDGSFFFDGYAIQQELGFDTFQDDFTDYPEHQKRYPFLCKKLQEFVSARARRFCGDDDVLSVEPPTETEHIPVESPGRQPHNGTWEPVRDEMNFDGHMGSNEISDAGVLYAWSCCGSEDKASSHCSSLG
ncbi:hypothetical protein QOT17_016968 [Balamuthia mandrillaris]